MNGDNLIGSNERVLISQLLSEKDIHTNEFSVEQNYQETDVDIERHLNQAIIPSRDEHTRLEILILIALVF
jgi:hypothetical protein